MEAFLLTKNLLVLLVCAPIHGICALLCARDARFFDLVLLYVRIRLPAVLANLRHWRASSYSPLIIEIGGGRPRRMPVVVFEAPSPMERSSCRA
jgi:type IV secretion system protein VirB3